MKKRTIFILLSAITNLLIAYYVIHFWNIKIGISFLIILGSYIIIPFITSLISVSIGASSKHPFLARIITLGLFSKKMKKVYDDNNEYYALKSNGKIILYVQKWWVLMWVSDINILPSYDIGDIKHKIRTAISSSEYKKMKGGSKDIWTDWDGALSKKAERDVKIDKLI